MYAANPLDRGRLLYAPSTTVHDPNPPLNLETPAGGIAQPLASTSAASSTTSGALVVAWVLAGSSADTSTTTGALPVSHPLAATSAGLSGTTGALRIDRLMAGTSASTSGTTGDLKNTIPLAGTSASTSTTVGALYFGLSGQCISTSAMTGDLTVNYALAATSRSAGVTGIQVLPDSLLFPGSATLPGAGSVAIAVKWGLAASSASTSTMRGGYTDIAGTSASASAMGYPQIPASNLYPAATLYPGLLGGFLNVGTVKTIAGTSASVSSMHAILLVTGATTEAVTITIFIGVNVTISVSFDDPVIESSDEAQVLIGVSDG